MVSNDVNTPQGNTVEWVMYSLIWILLRALPWQPTLLFKSEAHGACRSDYPSDFGSIERSAALSSGQWILQKELSGL